MGAGLTPTTKAELLSEIQQLIFHNENGSIRTNNFIQRNEELWIIFRDLIEFFDVELELPIAITAYPTSKPVSGDAVGDLYVGQYINEVWNGTSWVVLDRVATSLITGLLSFTDWTTFNNKQTALVSGTNIKTVAGSSLLGSGDVPALISLNALTGTTQTFATGTTGSDFNISSSGAVHTFHIPTASATVRGLLSTADWSTFNGKENVITFNNGVNRASNTVSIDYTRTGNVYSGNGLVSSPLFHFTGVPFTGGTSSTTKPFVLLQPTGTTSTSWSTDGTMFGINAANGFNGNIFDFKLNNTSYLKLSNIGSLIFDSAGQYSISNSGGAVLANVQVYSASGFYSFTSSTILSAVTNSTLLLTNAAANDFDRIMLGGTSALFPSIQRSGTGIIIRLANNSGNGGLTAATVNVSGATASELVGTDGSKNLVSLAVATYPSLTELTYLKGVTSSIQTQLGTKAPTASPTFTGTVTIPTPFTLGAISVTSTGTQLNYLSSATGTTGTTSTNLVFSTSPTLTTPICITNITTPLIIGGTGTTQTLIYKTTTGVGATGADHIFQVGNNGATEAVKIINAGNIVANYDAYINTVRVGLGNNSIASNTAIGYEALLITSVSSSANVALGYQSQKTTTDGTQNTSVGSQSLLVNTTGAANTSIGALSLVTNVIGSFNTSVGVQSLNKIVGNGNTGVGASSLRQLSTSSENNTAVGYFAGGRTSDTTSNSNNVFIGAYTAENIASNASNNILIGYDIDLQTAGGSNQLSIGNLIFGTGLTATGTTVSTGSVGIGIAVPNTSAILDLTSVLKGFLPPRMTTGQRDSISSPIAGLIIYNVTTNKINVYTSAWEAVTSA